MAKVIPFPQRPGPAPKGPFGRIGEQVSFANPENAALYPALMVVPVHNEEEHITAFLQAWRQMIPRMPLILVFDRCTDQSYPLAADFMQQVKCEPVHFLHIEQMQFNPYGKAGACLFGLWTALRYQVPWDYPVLFWDADNEYQLDPTLIESLIERLRAEGGMVSAQRSGSSLLRSRLALWATRWSLRLGLRRQDFPTDILTAVHGMPLAHCLLAMNGARTFDMETRIVHYTFAHHLPFAEFQVQYAPRIHGKKIKAWHLFGILLAGLGWR